MVGMDLFGQNEFNPIDSTDLTKYLLDNYPDTKVNPELFKEKWYRFLATKAKNGEDFVRLLMEFDILSGCRRRLELI